MISLTALKNQLDALTAQKNFCVAYSGGLDSAVLLHLMQALCDLYPCYALRAIHINHGLNAQADDWQAHCQAVCQPMGIRLDSYSVTVAPKAGESLEAVAREARYRSLAVQLKSDECLLTAHHADDQAETVLLQLLRGAGVSGLAAMPLKKKLGQGELVRPLLSVRREAIERYAVQKNLRWIEDSSNQDVRFDRNFLRSEVMPLLKKRWPKLTTTVSRSAFHCATTKEILQAVAAQDLSGVLDTDGTMDRDRLRLLPRLRQQEVVRYWIQTQGFRVPSQAKLDELFKNVIDSQEAASPCVSWGDERLRRYRRALHLMKKTALFSAAESPCWNLKEPLVLPQGLGILTAQLRMGAGLKQSFSAQSYAIRFRCGGEMIKPTGCSHTRPLKKLFQEWGVPPWLRARIPLLYWGEALVLVVGYTVAEGYAALSHEMGWVVHHN